MKLDEAFARLNISVDLIPRSSSNRPGTAMHPTYITIHNTANNSSDADALMHARYLKGDDARRRKVSWHFSMDDTRCVKHLPTNEVAWHAGPANTQSIAIEVCQNQGINKAEAISRASLLTAVLMSFYNIDTEHVVPHKFWTGKDCPEVILREPGGFDAFRRQAQDFLSQLSQPEAADERAVSEVVDPLPPLEDVPVERSLPPASGTLEERVAQLEQIIAQMTAEHVELQNQTYEAD
ncbi:MAG TPA: N-acetylmuramoyl-L-alanine amidase [Herpetosiphonaceae bacterium]